MLQTRRSVSSLLPSGRVLDPVERAFEILFGLIMVLTFTGSISVANAGEAEVRTELIAALGCNLAWGMVDAVMYLMGKFMGRARGLVTVRAVRAASEPDIAHQLVIDSLPPLVARVLAPQEVESLRQRLSAMPDPAAEVPLTGADLWGALGVFLLVFLSTLPVVLPFVVMNNAAAALRASNAIAVLLLFAAGWSLGRHAGRPGWRVGLAMVFIGMTLVAITMALGG